MKQSSTLEPGNKITVLLTRAGLWAYLNYSRDKRPGMVSA
jgi:hypothetical protein